MTTQEKTNLCEAIAPHFGWEQRADFAWVQHTPGLHDLVLIDLPDFTELSRPEFGKMVKALTDNCFILAFSLEKNTYHWWMGRVHSIENPDLGIATALAFRTMKDASES